ncbi:MAG TPA: aminoacyl-tRNA hydrolase [Methylophilaceae bacterium]|nr:aminoacyl-tRNA hydrolase [Methylophilaceae bacterium]
MNRIQLIVGLGNPGPEYEATRHNAGFWWVDQVAEVLGARLSQEAKFLGQAAKARSCSSDVWLLKPSTFMNRSGQSVAALANFYKIPPEAILVVHDELDLPPGTAKIKKGGGNGGHNGLKDISAHLGTQDYWRLRLGIGHPGDRKAVVNYVLHTPSKDEMQLIEESMDASAALLPMLTEGQMEAAMLKLHTKPKQD